MTICPHCPMTGTVTQIRIHLRDDHQENWFPCKECDLKLIKEEELSNHFRRNHYFIKDCAFCNESFAQYRGLSHHERDMHRSEMGLVMPGDFVPTNSLTLTFADVIKKFGMDVSGTIPLPTDNEYISFYDVTRKTPVFVLELLTSASIVKAYDTRPPFQPDEPLGDMQLTEAAVRSANLDVSHLAAAMCHRSSKQAYNSTFLWRNLIGLEASVNRGPVKAVECHQLALVPMCDTLLVITALHYAESNLPIPACGIGEMMKPDGVAKILVMLRQNRVATVDSFYIPNEVMPSQSIFRFRKNVDDIEALLKRKLLSGYGEKWRHVTDEVSTHYRCSIYTCRFYCELEADLTKHYKDAHSNYKCNLCKSKTFSTEEERREHMINDHRRFPCDQCEKVYSTGMELKLHNAKHSDERPFICEICGTSFKRPDNLNRHKKTHQELPKIQCPKCDATFKITETLRTHLIEINQQTTDLPRGVMLPKPFVSSNGNKTTLVKGHRYGTSKVKTFTCSECGKIFHHQGHYNDHLATHSDTRPFSCELCGKAFKLRHHLTGHKKLCSKAMSSTTPITKFFTKRLCNKK